MGATFMAGTIKGSSGIRNLKIVDDTEFTFEYQADNSIYKQYRVYAPTRADYEVSIEVIDRAIQNGFNLIVHDHWIFATHSGKDYAGVERIPIFSVPDFIKAIKSRHRLENG